MQFGKFKKSLKILAFLLMFNLAMADRPAHAATCSAICATIVTAVNAANTAIVTAIAAQTAALNTWLEKVILGTHAVNPVYLTMIPGGLPGQDSVPIVTKGPVLGLVDYFEKVYWPRWITFEQRIAQGRDKLAAADLAFANSREDTRVNVNHANHLKQVRAEHTVQTYQREVYACEHASRNVSLISNELYTSVTIRNETTQYLATLGGSADFPRYSKGLVNAANEKVLERKAKGYCDPKGNDGADSTWCPSAQPKLVGADQNPMTLLMPYTFQTTDQSIPSHFQHMQAYIQNLFPDSFTPFRPDQLKDMSKNAVTEVQAEQSKFMAQIATLYLPFAQALKQREPIEIAPEVSASYKASLAQVGVTDPNILGLYINPTNGALSKRAMEEIKYKIVNLDPQEVIKRAGESGVNMGNTLLTQTLKVMDIAVLLYDIRDELRQNNQLLGVIGSILSTSRHKEIEAKIRSNASGG